MCEAAWAAFQEHLQTYGLVLRDVNNEKDLSAALSDSPLTGTQRLCVISLWRKENPRTATDATLADDLQHLSMHSATASLSSAYAAVDEGRLEDAWRICQRLLAHGSHRVAAAILSSALHKWRPRIAPGTDRQAIWAIAAAPGVRQDEAHRDFSRVLSSDPSSKDVSPTELWVAGMWVESALDDIGRALRMYERAGDHAGALSHIGAAWHYGRGVEEPDHEKAKGFYERALALGDHVMAANNLAAILNQASERAQQERGDEREAAELAIKALGYCKKAAKAGESMALFNLGRRLSVHMPGIGQNVRAAVAALREAERLGDPDAAEALRTFEVC